ncbi:MAG: hypothetical protein KDA32_07675 [Phycisphaerales bacterium]|nr:hypothetical protein [Phycisphaerales bacterium]
MPISPDGVARDVGRRNLAERRIVAEGDRVVSVALRMGRAKNTQEALFETAICYSVGGLVLLYKMKTLAHCDGGLNTRE